MEYSAPGDPELLSRLVSKAPKLERFPIVLITGTWEIKIPSTQARSSQAFDQLKNYFDEKPKNLSRNWGQVHD